MQNMKTPEPELDTRGGSIGTWLGFALIMTILFGVIYPVLTTLLGQTIFPFQARGSLLERNGTVVGSSLIGQSFSGAQYFIGRPSNAGKGYDPTSASGSNLAVSNPALRKRAEATAQAIAVREGITLEQIPVDLIAASGSGLDPHISVAAAEIQVARVAKARGITEDAVREAIQQQTEQPLWSVFGLARVNVLQLNLALDLLN
jgi:potassium-transporting ATPase KdpC subunit